MTTLSEHLEAILLEVEASFGQHGQIEVTPIAGTPPEQYRITYHLRGFCKNQGGKIGICSEHVITLNLPFGFPHFPPSCKPETPVFHPDFDQAAICIGEFWETNQSLAELILHIGRMLCGEIYSTTNAFNEEAVIWYQENRDKLPLDTVTPGSQPSATPESRAASPLSVDTVDDLLFPDNRITGDDDTPARPRQDSILTDTIPDDPAGSPPDLRPPPVIQDQHQDSAPNANSLTTQRMRNEARKIHQEGEAFEHQGQPAQALARYQAVKALAPDFPEIDQDIDRVQGVVDMLGDWTGDDRVATDNGAEKKRAIAKSPEKKETPLAQNPPPAPRTQRESTRRPLIFLAVWAGIILLLFGSAYLYFNAQLLKAQKMYEQCRQLVDTGHLQDAEAKCSQALEQASRVSLVKQVEKDLLVDDIRQLLDSDQVRQGQALSKEKESGLPPKWQESLKMASRQLADGQWQEALDGYTHTLQLISEIPGFDRAIRDQIHNNIAQAEFNIALEAGEQALGTAEWESAKSHLAKAMDIAKQNHQIQPANITRIRSLVNQVEQNALIATGDDHFAKKDWTNALAAFELALDKERALSSTDQPIPNSLQERIVRTKIFKALEEGKRAFADAQWDLAIGHYQTAAQLLNQNHEILQGDNPRESQQKIARVMLHAAIIRDQQSAAGHLKNKEYKEGVNKLQAILDTINKSAFTHEREFQEIAREAKASVNQAREELLIAEHIAYLTKNYQKLFTQNNPALNPDNLVSPQAVFLKKIGDKSLYKIQCFEQGHGRPVLLQTRYLHDPATGKWHFYSGETTELDQPAEVAGQKILHSAYQARDNQIIAEQIAYLKENFQTLLTLDGPDLHPETLSNPEVFFQKKIGEKFEFLLQCLHWDTDRATTMKRTYLYDPATKRWQPVHQKR